MDKKTPVTVWRTARPDEFLGDNGFVRKPENWCFIPSGDPGLTRRIKSSAAYWVVVHKRKNRIEALGLLADAGLAAEIKAALAAERAAPEYQKKMAAAKAYREKRQSEYEKEFLQAVIDFLDFPEIYNKLAMEIASQVTAHAVPVGSGTVARTETIPLPRRAEAAVIAWMRHRTTAYDNMIIPKIKGERRAVRKMLADRSRALLGIYRRGEPVPAECPLFAAVADKILRKPVALKTD